MRNRFAGLILAAVVAAPAGAQSTARYPELGGFYGLIYTPVGALPEVVRARSPHDSTSRGSAELRFGRYKYRGSSTNFDNYGLSGAWPILSRVQLGATWAHRTCGSCSGMTMGAVDAYATLFHHKATEEGSSDTEVGLTGSFGIGKPSKDDFSARSFAFGLPLTVMLPQQNDGMLVLSAIPMVGYGEITDDSGVVFATVDTAGNVTPGATGTFGATRTIMAASFAYLFPNGFGLHGSVHRIALEESTTQYGFVASWRFGARRRN